MNLYPKNKLPLAEIKKFIILFYIIGVIGFSIPYARNIFIIITPFALLISSYLLFIYHNFLKKDLFVFFIIYLFGFLIEVVGVNTGLVFGSYNYGNALGLEMFNVPLIIGLNWLFLTYTSVSIAEKITNKKWVVLILAPSFMLVYDLILEQLAPILNMWSWSHKSIPFSNYIAWWIIGFVFTSFINVFKINTQNPLSFILFVCQFIFFLIIYLLFIIIK